jgi:hypothetical protein
MVDTSVKYFDSTMSGAPPLPINTAGRLLGVLDACLVDGFGSVELSSLVVAANVATATVSSGHNFAMISATGPVILISGATPSGLNGEQRVTVINSTQFTFTTTGISDQTASPAGSAKRAPAGYAKVQTGSNITAYQSTDINSHQYCWRVDDTYSTLWARIAGYSSMSDINTGIDLLQVVTGGGYFSKSSNNWRIIASSKGFFFSTSQSATTYNFSNYFGDIKSYQSNDPYGVIMATLNGTSDINIAGLGALATNNAGYMLSRSYSGTPNQVACALWSHGVFGSNWLGGATLTNPNPADLKQWFAHIQVIEGTTILRGDMLGLYGGLFASPAYGTIYDNVLVDGIQRTLMALKMRVNSSNSATFFVDITGPWG